MTKPRNPEGERGSQRPSVGDSAVHLGGVLCLGNRIGGFEGLCKVSLTKRQQRLPTSQSPSLRSVSA